MKAIHIKLWRDLKRLRAQVATIAMVVAIGVAGFVGMFSVHQSLQGSRDDFYRDNRLADVFANVKRAPVHLRERLAALPGVAEVQLDVLFDAQIDLPGVLPPVTGRFIGLDLARAHAGRQGINTLTLKRGRWPERDGALEALVSDRFAAARGLNPGDTVHAILNGKRERVHLVGTAASPEYVFASQGGAPDDQSFGIWWIDGARMTQAFDMQGAFNQVSLRLDAGQATAPVLAQVDRLLEPYGAFGAVGRDKQLSAKIVSDELDQLQVMGTVLPAIFLAVAMFILNVVLSRQVATQRSQIAALKALGYSDGAIAWHYIQLALAIAGLGVAVGLALSQLIGRGMLGLYDEVFRFNGLTYETSAWLVVVSALLAAAAAAAGTWNAIRAVVRLKPAQAMQPPAPPAYQPTLVERLGLRRFVSTGAMMVIRNFERRPLRAAFTVTGIALAVALQISGAFWIDAIAHIVDVQFRQVQQGDVLVNFHRPVPLTVVQDLKRLPGVIDAEPYRTEPVRVRLHGRSEDTALTGYRSDAQLMRVVDETRGAVAMPAHGVVLSSLLARSLGARVGDRIELEFRLWSQQRVEVAVVDIVHTMFGQLLYMNLDAMNALARDGNGVAEAALQVDPMAMDAFWGAVKAAPVISSVFDKAGTLAAFNKTTSRNMGVFSGILTLFAVAMAVGIIYNAARIALSERAWELASLRVLGMTRAEVSVLLLAELGAELLLALPIGALTGWGLASLMMRLMASDSIDFPVVIEPSTYASAALIVLAAGVVSALLVRRQIDRLDLVSVLKVRE
ncbi:ABC transporter permease [Hydrogenophaga sp.]|jgi:putative ABC transport system permease protein|uniref:ABC transporter permease n=1 Tax=Hydrogenophaga sp. TaxID=1904254 RepID=UPI0027171AB8|nr:ABC transporter permease [Hydrogenophaga sp.]MDO9252264.1 ABC transporter permease [Hydrogenophaga sp.]MDP3884913.1 ABC transporter permease [Hydrogenophaga sp.]MDZ4358695.1 ABC transporter permease [Variovorax sp.]